MTRVVSLSPSGTVISNGSGLWLNTAGGVFGTSNLPEIATDTTGTYTGISVGSGNMQFEMSSYTLTPQERVAGIRLTVRELHNVGNQSFAMKSAGNAQLSSGDAGKIRVPYSGTSGRYVLRQGGLVVPTVGTYPMFTQSDIDDLRVTLNAQTESRFTLVTYVKIDLTIQTQPTVDPSVVSGPTGTSNPAPRVSWTRPEDTQYSYQVRIFNRSEAVSPGFDPNLSHGVYDSGYKASSYTYHDVPRGVLSGASDYSVFVQVSTVFAGWNWSGDWGSPFEFTTDINPTVAFSYPTSAMVINDTSYPEFKFSLTVGDPAKTAGFYIIMFDQDHFTLPGFDPASTMGPVFAASLDKSATSFTAFNPIGSGVYRVYLMAKNQFVTIDGITRYADWTYVEFTVDPPLPAPLENVSANGVEMGVAISYDKPAGQEAFDPWSSRVERLESDGTWVKVIGIDDGESFSWLDPFGIVGDEIHYRVFSESMASGGLVSSIPVEVVATRATKHVHLTAFIPGQASPSATLNVQGNWLESTVNDEQAIYKTLGSKLPRVISGPGRFESFSVSFVVVDQLEMQLLEAMLDFSGPLCLVTSKKRRFVKISGAFSISEFLWEELRGEESQSWKVSIPFIQIGLPSAE